MLSTKFPNLNPTDSPQNWLKTVNYLIKNISQEDNSTANNTVRWVMFLSNKEGLINSNCIAAFISILVQTILIKTSNCWRMFTNVCNQEWHKHTARRPLCRDASSGFLMRNVASGTLRQYEILPEEKSCLKITNSCQNWSVHPWANY